MLMLLTPNFTFYIKESFTGTKQIIRNKQILKIPKYLCEKTFTKFSRKCFLRMKATQSPLVINGIFLSLWQLMNPKENKPLLYAAEASNLFYITAQRFSIFFWYRPLKNKLQILQTAISKFFKFFKLLFLWIKY